jgi:hypothetical protein
MSREMEGTLHTKMHMKSPILYRGDFIPKDGALMVAF